MHQYKSAIDSFYNVILRVSFEERCTFVKVWKDLMKVKSIQNSNLYDLGGMGLYSLKLSKQWIVSTCFCDRYGPLEAGRVS